MFMNICCLAMKQRVLCTICLTQDLERHHSSLALGSENKASWALIRDSAFLAGPFVTRLGPERPSLGGNYPSSRMLAVPPTDLRLRRNAVKYAEVYSRTGVDRDLSHHDAPPDDQLLSLTPPDHCWWDPCVDSSHQSPPMRRLVTLVVWLAQGPPTLAGLPRSLG